MKFLVLSVGAGSAADTGATDRVPEKRFGQGTFERRNPGSRWGARLSSSKGCTPKTLIGGCGPRAWTIPGPVSIRWGHGVLTLALGLGGFSVSRPNGSVNGLESLYIRD